MPLLRTLAVCLIAASPLVSQPPSRGPLAAFGHIHLNSADPDKAIAFWTDFLGASTYSRGALKGIGMSGALILFDRTAPSAPSAGSAVDYLALHVPDLQPYMEKLAKTEYKSFQPVPGGPDLIIDGPDGVRIELSEDNAMYSPMEFNYTHFSSAHPAEMQAWYGRIFGARTGPDDKANTSHLPGGTMVFGHADSAAPTAGRAIDHVAFEIKGLETFCAKLAADGVKFDTPYRSIPELKMASAWLTDPWGTRIELTEGLAH